MPIEYSKLYRPGNIRLNKMESLLAENLVAESEGYGVDFIARTSSGSGNRIKGRHFVTLKAFAEQGYSTDISLKNFQISYSFPSKERNIFFPRGTYGQSMFSFRLLYEYLCELYNNNIPFIDEYLEGEFQYTNEYEELQALNERIFVRMSEEVHQKGRELRGDTWRGPVLRDEKGRFMSAEKADPWHIDAAIERLSGWQDFDVWKDDVIRQEVKELGRKIRERIIVSLELGEIPLHHSNAASTIKRKEELGFSSPESVFYASGQLINTLNIYIALDTED